MTLHARDAGALAMVRNAFIFSGEKSNVRDSKQLSIHLQSTEVRQLVRIANEASEIASINDFCAWTQSSVRKLFPHEALIAGLARRQNERISVEGLVSAGFPMAFIAAVTRRRGGSFACPTLEAWFRENSPQLFDPKSASIGRPTAATSEFEAYGLKNYRSVLVNRIKMQGMIVFDWAARYPEAWSQLGEWVTSGQIKYRETIADGLQSAPRAFVGLLKGENVGKQLVRLNA